MSTVEDGRREYSSEKKNNKTSKFAQFDWSLKPLIVCIKFISGINLNVIKRRSPSSNAVCFLVPMFGLLVIFCKLAINGPCAFQINQKSQNWGENLNDRNESPFTTVPFSS